MTRIEEIKRAVEAGEYVIDPAKVADAMLVYAEESIRPNRAERNCAIRALQYEGLTHREIGRVVGVSESVVRRIIDQHHRPAL